MKITRKKLFDADSADIDGAIFDFDGTLFDSLWLWEDIDRRFLAARGIAVPCDYMTTVGAMEYRRTAEYTIERFGLDETPEALMAEWTAMSVEAYATVVKPKPHIVRIAKTLFERGVPLAVATSATMDMCMPALKNNGLENIFSAVVTTHGIGKGKTDPDVYFVAANRIAVDPQRCAVFEDNIIALETAKTAGFITVGVHDKLAHSHWKDICAVADMIIPSHRVYKTR